MIEALESCTPQRTRTPGARPAASASSRVAGPSEAQAGWTGGTRPCRPSASTSSDAPPFGRQPQVGVAAERGRLRSRDAAHPPRPILRIEQKMFRARVELRDRASACQESWRPTLRPLASRRRIGAGEGRTDFRVFRLDRLDAAVLVIDRRAWRGRARRPAPRRRRGSSARSPRSDGRGRPRRARRRRSARSPRRPHADKAGRATERLGVERSQIAAPASVEQRQLDVGLADVEHRDRALHDFTPAIMACETFRRAASRPANCPDCTA